MHSPARACTRALTSNACARIPCQVLISPAGYPSTDMVPILNPFNWLGYSIGAALAVVKVPALGEAVTAIGTFCIQELIMRAPPSFKCLLRSLAEQDLSSAEPFFLIHLCAQIKSAPSLRAARSPPPLTRTHARFASLAHTSTSLPGSSTRRGPFSSCAHRATAFC